MKAQVDTQEALRRVREEASASCAFFYTWRALDKALGDPLLLYRMNSHSDFFRTVKVGAFRSTFISLGKIFDKPRSSVGLRYLVKCLKKESDSSSVRELEDVFVSHRRTIDGVRSIRNKAIAHNDPDGASKIFDEARITPDQIAALIDSTQGAVNTVATSPKFGFNRIASGDRNTRAVASLLDALGDCE